MHLLAPLGLFPAAPAVGWTLIALAFALAVWAAVVFYLARTPVMPRETPAAIVTSGPYRFSRNPIYLADAAILAGWGVVLGSLWPILAVPVFCRIIRKRFIEGEEAALRREFAAEWKSWSATTRRWL